MMFDVVITYLYSKKGDLLVIQADGNGKYFNKETAMEAASDICTLLNKLEMDKFEEDLFKGLPVTVDQPMVVIDNDLVGLDEYESFK